MMYGSWDIEHKRQNLLPFSAIFIHANNPKYQNSEKIKKTPGDIILHMSTIFTFWNIFLPFYPPPQGFPNSSKEWGVESKLLVAGIFTRWREPEEWFWQFKPIKMLKTAFCEYWSSIKIKINMWPKCLTSMKLKQKRNRNNNDYS